MTVDNMLHLIAGFFVVVSVALGYYVSPYFYFFTAFVGLNLMQSAVSGWCPMMTFLRWMGFKEA
jgi:ABC-type multidrug transport system permease subunit